MKKLGLDLDSIAVESFETSTREVGRGTVRAHATDACDLTDVNGYGCTNPWCAGETSAPCWAATQQGHSCDTTCAQILCGCTFGGPDNGTCDAVCNTVAVNC